MPCRLPAWTAYVYLIFLPPGQINVVAEEVSRALVCHLSLQTLQQVSKPLEGLSLGAQPVEVDLKWISEALYLHPGGFGSVLRRRQSAAGPLTTLRLESLRGRWLWVPVWQGFMSPLRKDLRGWSPAETGGGVLNPIPRM